jgi:hypothetical protein
MRFQAACVKRAAHQMPPPDCPLCRGRKMARIIAKGSLKPYAQKAFERFFRLPETHSAA